MTTLPPKKIHSLNWIKKHLLNKIAKSPNEKNPVLQDWADGILTILSSMTIKDLQCLEDKLSMYSFFDELSTKLELVLTGIVSNAANSGGNYAWLDQVGNHVPNLSESELKHCISVLSSREYITVQDGKIFIKKGEI